MGENIIGGRKSGGTAKLCAGWSDSLVGSVLYGTACGYFEAGTGERFLARGPTYTRNQVLWAKAKNV